MVTYQVEIAIEKTLLQGGSYRADADKHRRRGAVVRVGGNDPVVLLFPIWATHVVFQVHVS